MYKPTSVVIGPISYQIDFGEMTTLKLRKKRINDFEVEADYTDEIAELEGCISHQDSLITINERLEPSYKRVVLMHEILHGMSTVARIDLTEAQCDQLAYAMIDFLNDNPDLVGWLQ